MSSFLAVGSILAIQFQRFLCSFYLVQLVLTSSGIPMLKPNFCDGNQQHGPASDVACSPLFEGKKMGCRQKQLGMHLQIYSANINPWRGSKGHQWSRKGTVLQDYLLSKKVLQNYYRRFSATNISKLGYRVLDQLDLWFINVCYSVLIWLQQIHKGYKRLKRQAE